MSGTPAQTGDTFGEQYPGGPPPVPRAARVLRTVAVIAVVVAAVVGVIGVWRAQTGNVNDRKLAEKHAHERAYSQLAGDPTGPGAARVENITITDGQILRARGSASGTLLFTVYNSGPADHLRSVAVTVDGVAVPRMLYAATAGAEPQPLPAEGLPLGTGEQRVFTDNGASLVLIGLPSAAAGRRAEVTVGFSRVGAVRFAVPVEPAA